RTRCQRGCASCASSDGTTGRTNRRRIEHGTLNRKSQGTEPQSHRSLIRSLPASRWKAPTPPASHPVQPGRHPGERPFAGGLPISDPRALEPGRSDGPTKPSRMSRFEHRPVMVDEVVELLRPVPVGLIVDATVGAGGHSAAILTELPGATVLG